MRSIKGRTTLAFILSSFVGAGFGIFVFAPQSNTILIIMKIYFEKFGKYF